MESHGNFAVLTLLFVCTMASFASVGCPQTDPLGPAPIRMPEETHFTFPTDQKFFSAGTYDQIRSHAWAVFAGITQNSVEGDPCSPPIWDTWFANIGPPSKNGYEKTGPVRLDISLETLTAISQGSKSSRHRRRANRLGLDGDLLQLILQNKHFDEIQTFFNAAAHGAIIDNKLYETNTLQNLLDAAKSKPVADRKIDFLPRESIVVKAKWVPIVAGENQVSFWDIIKSRKDCENGCFRSIRVVKAEEGDKCNLPVSDMTAVLSSCFYSVKDDGQPGRELILMGLHVITKEAPDWTWSTFWWSPTASEGQYSAGRFDAPIIDGFWRNYLMNTTVSMTMPTEDAYTRGVPQAKTFDPCGQNWRQASNAKVVFNPFIENPDQMHNAALSNCMNCHKRSTYPGFRKNIMMGTPWRGELASGAKCFSKQLRLDYLWSLSQVDPHSELGLLYKNVLQELKTELPSRYEFH